MILNPFKVNHIPFGKIGYVANSVRTTDWKCIVLVDSMTNWTNPLGSDRNLQIWIIFICKVFRSFFLGVKVYQQDACGGK